MSRESVRVFLSERAPDIEVVELARSSETNFLAAAWGVEPAQIAKALASRVDGRNILLMACGDSRLDNKKLKNGWVARCYRPAKPRS
jgi:prolyl-tRNA editing enzyme YbaK/EbsC (Cys-tRNA(Pro) deacylase)